MHGIIFSELKKFVATRHGEAAWKQVLEGASLKQDSLERIRKA